MEFLRNGFQIIGFKGDVSLGLLDSHHILIRFAVDEDYYRCWIRSSWNFKNHVMRILKWTPDFSATHDPPVAPVWVSFHHLPIHMFQKGPLLSLASLIGRPMRIDAATKTLQRPSVARGCIELNLLKNLPKRVWIEQGDSGFWQPISYDALTSYCTECSRLGHALGNCSDLIFSKPKKPQQTQEWRPKPPQTDRPSASGLSFEAKLVIPTDNQYSKNTEVVVVLDSLVENGKINEAPPVYATDDLPAKTDQLKMAESTDYPPAPITTLDTNQPYSNAARDTHDDSTKNISGPQAAPAIDPPTLLAAKFSNPSPCPPSEKSDECPHNISIHNSFSAIAVPTEELSSDEGEDFATSEDPTLLVRSLSVTDLSSKPPENMAQENNASQHEPSDDSRLTNTKKGRRNYQKLPFGQSLLVTRSKACTSNALND